jgi:hypothetical protein
MISSLVPISVGQDNRCDERPEVQQNDEPARNHLDPNTEHALVYNNVSIISQALATNSKNEKFQRI